MQSKTIWHVGGYNRNYGDFVLLESMRENLSKISPIPLNFVNIDCQSTHFFPELIEQLNNKAAMLLIGGGGFIMNRHEDNSLSGWQWSIKNEDIKKIKCPLVVYGIGYNKFHYDERGFKANMNDSLKETLKKARLFSTRNEGTKAELVRRGLEDAKITVIPDPGMFITPLKIEADFLKQKRMLVGINFVADRPQYTFPPNYEESKLEVWDNLIKTCEYLIQKYQALIINIDHIPALDSEVNALFKEKLGENYLVLSEELPQIYPPSLVNAHYLAYIYQQIDLVLGMRGHSNIIAFGMGTPFISIGSHNKNRFFLQEILEEDYLIDLRNYKENANCDIIVKKIEKLLNDKEYQKRTAKRRAELKQRFDNFNQQIIEILKENI